MSCCDVPGLMPVNDAIDRLLAQVKCIEDIETLELKDALGRVLAEDQFSTIDVPAFDNSAMDGYAVKLSSLEQNSKLPMSQRIIAGDAADVPLEDGSCARIFTGAPVPDNCDAVVMQEHCNIVEENGQVFVQFPQEVKHKQNIRPLGQDIGVNQQTLKAGARLKAQELGLLASIGINEIPVKRRLKIAVLSTGNEIIEPGQPIQKGQIYNSNHYTLIGLIEANGYEVYDCGTVIDDADLIKQALLDAAENADCIITSGGVSVGEEDHVKNMVEELGRLELWKIAIKPGKPFAFGYVNETPFIGLPGNPSAVFATFNVVAKPYLVAYQGNQGFDQLSFKVKANFEIHKTAIREQYLYVKAQQKEGELWLEKYPNQSSGVLSSTAWSNGFAKIPINTQVKLGDFIEFIPF